MRETVTPFTSETANLESLDSIRVDGFSLPMQNFVDRMPHLRQGLIRGVFQTKASSPWAGNKSQSIQVSLCLPNKRDFDTWYEAVFTLPIAWPDITDIDPYYLKKTPAHQLYSHADGSVSHLGRNFATMAPTNSSSVESRSWLPAGRLEELLILNMVAKVNLNFLFHACHHHDRVANSATMSVYWWLTDATGSCLRPLVALSLVTSKRMHGTKTGTKLFHMISLTICC